MLPFATSITCSDGEDLWSSDILLRFFTISSSAPQTHDVSISIPGHHGRKITKRLSLYAAHITHCRSAPPVQADVVDSISF